MRLGLFAVLISVTLHAAAVPLRVDFSTRNAGTVDCLGRMVLVAKPLDGTASARDLRVITRQHVSSYVLERDGTQPIEIGVESEHCWAASQVVHQKGATVPLYRAVVAQGEYSAPDASYETSGRVFLAKEPGETAGHAVPCKTENRHWQCSVPADTAFDLRLSVPGVAALYWWDLIARPGKTLDLEPQRLVRGSSFSGWVQDGRGNAIAGATVQLEPLEPDPANRAEKSARSTAAVTNKRGFFQIAGLAAGAYRLLSRAAGLSDARIAEVTLEEGEAQTWPRAITHLPLSGIDIAVDPATDRAGRPWVIVMTEQAAQAKPVTRTAVDGHWSAKGLNAGTYRVVVRTADGATIERTEADLSNGPVSLALHIRSFLVRGRLLAGQDPIAADIRFTNGSGQSVAVTSDDQGRFETGFPVAGKWRPEIRYPAGTGARVTAAPIELAGTADPQDADIVLPGGRLHGIVVTPSGDPERAAVHVVREKSLVAQQRTDEKAAFDLIGLAAGTYAVTAEGMNGTTPRPITVSVAEDETVDLRIVVEPYRKIAGTVLTPYGTPGSGCAVMISSDGVSWSKIMTDVGGFFSYHLPGGAPAVQLLVLSYSYPAALVRVSSSQGEPLTITLPPQGGVIRATTATPSIPYVTFGDTVLPWNIFYFPEPFGRFAGGIHVPPGSYTVCPTARVDNGCRSVNVVPGAEVTVDLRSQENAAK